MDKNTLKRGILPYLILVVVIFGVYYLFDVLNTKVNVLTYKELTEAIVDHRASLEYEARSVYGKLVSSADRAIDVDDMLRRSIAFQTEKHKSENPTIEQIIEYSFKKLSSKYGNGGYAKMYFQDDKYKDYLAKMNKILSDKNEFIKAELELIEKDKD